MEIRSMFDRFEPRISKTLLVIFMIYLALIQFTTSYPYIHLLPVPTPAFLTLVTSVLFFIYYRFTKKQSRVEFQIDRFVFLFIFTFIVSIVLAILSSLFTTSVIFSVEYINTVKQSILTRVIYYLTFVGTTYYAYKTLTKLEGKRILKIINVYPISILILTIVGIWQLGYFLLDIPFLDIDTRSYLHSVTGSTMFDFRLTSFADEPSYLGPILIDMLILGFLVFKRKWLYVPVFVIPAMIVLMFSFSVSAYLNLVFIVGFLLLVFLFHPKVPKKYLWYLLIAVVVAIVAVLLLKPDLVAKFFSPIIGRLDGLFNPEKSTRMYMYVMPLVWLFDHSWVSALFGYGPGSFDFLAATKITPKGANLSLSSNNMYIDLLFEHGIIGFGIILVVLVMIFIHLLKRCQKNTFYLIALLEFVHLMVTSLYRADFVTPRFWMMMLIVFLLMRIGEESEKANKFDGVKHVEK